MQRYAVSKWTPWFEFGGFYNSRDDDGTGSFGTSRGETTLFAPITGGQRDLFFGQITAKFFSDDAREGNLAIGYRRMLQSGFNLGAWIGVDARNTEISNTFWQLSGGFEALSHNFDARLNWYGPVTEPQSGVAGFAQAQIVGTQLVLTGGREVALQGVDGELGVRVPLELAKIDPNVFELRVYGGGYYFDDSEAIRRIAGVKGRIELRVNDVIPSMPGSRLTAEYEISHDDVRDTRHEVGLRVRIPLSGSKPARALASLTGQERRMLDGLERDTDIVTVRSKAETVEDALTGTDFERVAFASTGNNVTTTSAAAGANSLVILNGAVSGPQTLQANQTLQGGGSTIAVRGLKSGTVVNFTAPGAAGSLTAPGTGNDNLTLAGSNTHVSGLTIVGGGNENGVEVGSNKSNVFLTNLAISATGLHGINIGETNTVSVIGGSITTAGADGVHMAAGNTVSIANLAISNVGEEGLVLEDNNTVTVSNTTISNTGSFGVLFFGSGNALTISGSTITNALDGINNPFGSNQLSVTGTTFSAITDDAFDLSGTVTLLASGNTFTGTIGDNVFEFNGSVAVQPGSDGNTAAGATIGGRLCDAGGSFTGSIVVDGVTLVDNIAPCN